MEARLDQLNELMQRYSRGEESVFEELMMDHGMPSRFGSDGAPPEELFQRVQRAVAATPAPRTTTRLRIMMAAAVVPVLTAAILLGASHIVYHRPALRIHDGTPVTVHLLVVLLLIIGLTLSATGVVLGRGKRGLGSGAVALFLVAVLVTPIFAVLTLVDPVEMSLTPEASLATLSPWGPRCLTISMAVGLLVLFSFTTALRRSAPAASRLRGAAVGAAAGAWGGLSVFVFCPAIEYRHLLVGHVLPIAAITLVGLVAIPRALRP